MPKVTNNIEPQDTVIEAATQQPLTLEQENNAMLKEILRNVRWVRRIYTISLTITITLIVLPLIASAFLLPKFIRTFASAYGQYAEDAGLSPNGNIFDLLQQLQNSQEQLNQQQQELQQSQ